jgi:hypothetical protein
MAGHELPLESIGLDLRRHAETTLLKSKTPATEEV